MYNQDYQKWRALIKPEKKLRKYQHIDNPLDLNSEDVFQKIIHILEHIKDHQFLPFVKRINKKIRFRKDEKGKFVRNPKNRPIMYASHADSHIYSYYNFIFQNKYEHYLERLGMRDNVIAYRKIKDEETDKGKCNIHFSKEVFGQIYKQGDCVVITQDITGFFDNIDHSLLKEKICKIVGEERLEGSFYKVLKSLTKYKYINYLDLKKIRRKVKNNKYAIYQTLKNFVNENKSNKGIPQGSPISGLLANIYLVDFDYEIKIAFPDIFYRRYSDDLIFICKNAQKDELLKCVNKKIAQSRLEISASKSFIAYFNKNEQGVVCQKVTDGLEKENNRDYVDYLGFEFNGKNIFLRKRTIQSLKHKQENKAKMQLSNTEKQKRRRPRKIKQIAKRRSNYFKRTLDVINDSGIKKQVLRVAKDRNNKIKKIKEIIAKKVR